MAKLQRVPENQQDLLHTDTSEWLGDGKEHNEEEKENLIEDKPIGKEQIRKAQKIFDKYKEGKRNLEDKIVQNEQWYKMRHWQQLRKLPGTEYEPKPASGWLFNVITSKHADFMDSYPDPVILPREEGDKEEAKKLSSIVPCILEQNEFTQTYSDCSWYKLKNGTACYGVFFDPQEMNGLGSVKIEKVDLLNLFWEPGVTDIQKSRHVFYVEMMDVELVEQMYPELKGKIKTDTSQLKKYVYDDTIRTDDKCIVVDWYYKKYKNGKETLQFCKFVGEEVLYASENEMDPPTEIQAQPVRGADGMIMDDGTGQAMVEPVEVVTGESMSDRGWYDHGLYPFVFDVLFPEEGLPTGFGFIDIGKEAQESIDRLNNDIEINSRWATRPRWFMRGDGGINEEEYNDLSKTIVHVDSNLGSDSIMRIETQQLSGIYLDILANKVDELKEITGNRDVSNGGSTAGVTAASGIAALQEQAGKGSRDMIMTSYRAYAKIINMVIELIRQFYDAPRQYRIIGEQGREEFVTYDNSGIQPQSQGQEFGVDMGMRLPVFDIKVSAQKASPYAKVSQNELALQFFNNGFFNPQLTDQVLACMDMMDFEGKDGVTQKVSMNGTIYQQLMQTQQQMLQMAELIDQAYGTQMSEQIAASINMGQMDPTMDVGGGGSNMAESDVLGGLQAKENGIVSKARERANEATKPQ